MPIISKAMCLFREVLTSHSTLFPMNAWLPRWLSGIPFQSYFHKFNQME